jgi:hypothetical protein
MLVATIFPTNYKTKNSICFHTMYLVFRTIPSQNNKYLSIEILTIGLPKGSTDPKMGRSAQCRLISILRVQFEFFLSPQNLTILCCDVKEYQPSPGKGRANSSCTYILPKYALTVIICNFYLSSM